ncbi:MAG TPA: hypothetical protein PKL57_18710 [Candidatus Wallbacteria bacterium]|nr:hypothetical protein [Candidatus Wallbacteria bacterium]
MFNSTFRFSKPILLLTALICLSFLTACGGGGGENNSLVNEQVPLSGSNTVIADTVKVNKTADGFTVDYQTNVPVKNSFIVTSNFAFNNAPLWSEFHEVKTEDGLKHTATIKAGDNKNFMIYTSPQDKFDNGGKGIDIK